MEAALEVVSDLRNVGDVVVLNGLSVLFAELEVDFVRQEKFQEKLHNLLVFLQLEVVVVEHLGAACHQELAPAAVQVHSRDRSIARVGEGPACQNRVCPSIGVQCATLYVHIVDPRPLGLFLVLLLVIVLGPHHEHVVDPALGLLGVAVDDPGDLFVEDSVVDVGFFGVEIFIEGGPDNTVAVDGDAELGGDFVL